MRGMLLVKRLITAAVVAVMLVLFQGTSASAAAGGATIGVSDVSFVITSESCSNLPDGTTIEGSGTLKSITTTRTDANGITTVRNTSHARGTATDQDGNTYVFLYSNEFRVSNSAADPDMYSGLMTDHFSLSGPGPARLSNGFTARFTTDLVDVSHQLRADPRPRRSDQLPRGRCTLRSALATRLPGCAAPGAARTRPDCPRSFGPTARSA